MNLSIEFLMKAFFVFLVASFITGPTTSEISIIFLSVLLIFVGLSYLMAQGYSLKLPALFIPVILLVGAAFLSLVVAYANGEEEGTRFFLFFRRFRNVLVVPVVYYTLMQIKDWRKLWVIPALIAGVMSLYAFYQHYTGIDLLRAPERDFIQSFGEYYAAIGPFSHRITFSYVYSMVALFSFSAILYSRLSARYKILLLIGTLLTSFAVFFSYCRAAWIALVVGMVFVAFLRSKKTFVLTALLLLSFVAGAMLFSPSLRERASTFVNLLHSDQLEKVDYSTYSRLLIWRASIDLFQEHPVLGIGYGNYSARRAYLREKYPDKQLPDHPHSTYFQMLSDCGILGLIALLSLLVGAFYIGLSALKRAPPTMDLEKCLLIAALGGIVIFAVFSLVDEPLASGIKSKATWFCFGLLAAAAGRLREGRRVR